jgi:hypothetical protein
MPVLLKALPVSPVKPVAYPKDKVKQHARGEPPGRCPGRSARPLHY